MHVLFCSADPEGVYTVSDASGVIIVNPDMLLSGTSVVAGCFCQRKAVLNERFKGVDKGNQVMLVGSLVHELFQDVVHKQQENRRNKKRMSESLSKKEIDELLLQLLRRAWVVRDMYGLGITEGVLYQEMSNFLPHIHNWINKYMSLGSKQVTTSSANTWKGN